MEKLVSIVIPAYNVGSYLDYCITSIVKQSYKNIEILIVNDGSSDNTKDICNNWEVKDSRVRVFHKKNGGVSSARNLGISKANGQYIMFVDGDDWLDINAVELLVDHIEKTRAEACFCNCYYKNEDVIIEATKLETDTTYSSIDIALQHLHYRFIASPCLCLCRFPLVESISNPLIESLTFSNKSHPKFSEDIHTLEDWEFNLRLILSTEKIAILSTPYYHYRSVEGSASKSPLNKRKMSCFLIPDKAKQFVENNYPNLSDHSKYIPIFLIYHMLVIYSSSGAIENTINDLRRISQEHLVYAWTAPIVSLRSKLYVTLASIHPYLFKFFYNLKNK